MEQTSQVPQAVMEDTMQGELDKQVSKAGAAIAGTDFAKFKEERRAGFDIQSREFGKYTRELRTETEQR
ncbi:MAG: hypothetical protein ACRED2_02095, partial [Methylocella sp.]